MALIRLFTSGTHKGLSYTNQDIEAIAKNTADFGADLIPFVMGHPKKDYPVMGHLPKSGIVKYTEGDRVSLGFDKQTADMGDESMEVLRALGQNKLSIRLREGVIRHIGLVKQAAVADNNTQDFAALTGDFAADDPLFDQGEENTGGFLSSLQNIANIFKTNTKTMTENEATAKRIADLEAVVKENSTGINKIVDIITKQNEATATAAVKASTTADFSGADFSHLTDTQRADFAAFCAGLPESKREAYKAHVKSMNQKPTPPANGSATVDFVAQAGDQKRTAEDIVRAQMSNN